MITDKILLCKDRFMRQGLTAITRQDDLLNVNQLTNLMFKKKIKWKKLFSLIFALHIWLDQLFLTPG